ncbi:AEC family transporter [Thalassolituus marinus]|jgi:malonate transporter|uniref:AEC family transporter n=1 Tax=Thalassolituus marinus TaxID=671053 RepID=A0ABS7ZRH5_9GAMM|nr:AEC family transporter [Thalassolituus marinus]MCA6064212.1 AEC family transporter [Thalassolituus marinus]
MAYILSTLAPIFGLILLGFTLRRTQRLGEHAASELNRLVVWLCLPALLFTSTATAPLHSIWHPGFVMAFTLATLSVYGLTLVWRLAQGLPLSSASLDALGASYANTGYVGIPLCLFVLGDDGLAPALVSTLIVVSLLFAIAVVAVEVSLHRHQGVFKALAKVLLALSKNPLVVSPLIGIGWNLAGFGVHDVAGSLLKLLGDATVPCALISLGAFLAQKQASRASSANSLVLIKLIVHPALTWLLAFYVFELPTLWASAAVLLSALPTGTGPYMLAEFYKHEASVVSRTILLSTVGSVLTLAGLLAVL